jgi:lipid-binding SYLF domain-containing protein
MHSPSPLRLTHFAHLALAFCIPAAAMVGCGASTSTEYGRQEMATDVELALAAFYKADPSLQKLVDSSYGYAIFPSIGKGGFGVGGSFGRGSVYETGKLVGYTSVKAGSIGFQLGGQAFRELIVFENKPSLDKFKRGEVEFAANATAVAANAGAAASSNFKDGSIVFTTAIGGLMYEASIGGQGFDYTPAP